MLKLRLAREGCLAFHSELTQILSNKLKSLMKYMMTPHSMTVSRMRSLAKAFTLCLKKDTDEVFRAQTIFRHGNIPNLAIIGCRG